MSLRPFTHYINLLARYLRPQWRATTLMAVLLIASIGLQLLNPQILRVFIDAIFTHGLSNVLIMAALLYLGISLLKEGISMAAHYLSEKVAWIATNQLRTDLLAHVLKLDLAFHQSHTPGELIERIDGDVNELSNFFSEFLVNLLFYAILLLSMLIALAVVNWILGLGLGLYTIIVVIIVVWLRRPVMAQKVKWREADARFFGFLGEQLTAIEDLHANGAKDYVIRRFLQLYHFWFVTIRKAGLTGATPWIISQALYKLGGVLGLVLGAYLWSIGLATPGHSTKFSGRFRIFKAPKPASSASTNSSTLHRPFKITPKPHQNPNAARPR